jgi:hypothetical protein
MASCCRQQAPGPLHCMLLPFVDVPWLLKRVWTCISGCLSRTLPRICATYLLLAHTMFHCYPQAATAAVAKKIFVPAEAASLAVEVAKPKPPADQLLPPSAAVAVEQVCTRSCGNIQGCLLESCRHAHGASVPGDVLCCTADVTTHLSCAAAGHSGSRQAAQAAADSPFGAGGPPGPARIQLRAIQHGCAHGGHCLPMRCQSPPAGAQSHEPASTWHTVRARALAHITDAQPLAAGWLLPPSTTVIARNTRLCTSHHDGRFFRRLIHRADAHC